MLYTFWIVISCWMVCTGWILSCFKELNFFGYLASLALFFLTSAAAIRLNKTFRNTGHFDLIKRLKRFSKPIPFIFLLYLLAAVIGGALYAPNNYDAICYRLPRILHWLSAGQWHWIGTFNSRMDFSATGYEWLMLPFLVLFKTDRPLFLINIVSYALLPGLLYSVFSGLGISRRVAWYWMWLLPAGYCFVLQAGSVGNDCFAAVYFLSAAAFALRAVKRSSVIDAYAALLSAALLTGAKASNLPLLLPLTFLFLPLRRMLFSRPLSSLGVLLAAMLVSAAPIAIGNTFHTGDWSGDPFNSYKVKSTSPIAGIAGNTLQLSIGALTPPVFPPAAAWASRSAELLAHEPFSPLKARFPKLDLGIAELPQEESAGLGLGITLLLALSLCASLLPPWRGIASRTAMSFGLLCWAAALAYMVKINSECTARLLSPYYPGLILPILALGPQARLVRKRLWKTAAIACQLCILPALLLDPARPLLPIRFLIQLAEREQLLPALTQRAKNAYSVYSGRNDDLAEVREHISAQAKTIGFAGTGNDPEYSLWRPLGMRRVKDLAPVSGTLPDLKGVDNIVGSEQGFKDRYQLTALEVVDRTGGKIAWEGKVAIFAAGEPVTWYVIAPGAKGRFTR